MSNIEQEELMLLLCKYTAPDQKLDWRERKKLSRYKHLLDFSIYQENLLKLAQIEQETDQSWEAFLTKHGDTIDPHTIVVITPPPPVYRLVGVWVAGSAAALILLVVSYFLFKPHPATQRAVVAARAAVEDIGPGGFKATLKLDDSSEIVLDPGKTGIIATQGNIQISQPKQGQLVYQASAVSSIPHVFVNELTTPRAGKYQVILPDGSLVILNADTRLRYPSTFTGKERDVELLGEGFFEIAKDKKKPFRLQVEKVTIEVLGTHFNVQAYKNEGNKTTLLSGNIRIKSTTGPWRSVKPGQQAWLDSAGHIKVMPTGPDEIKQAIAWKTDSIYSENASVKEIMQQLGRWYDATIIDSAGIGNKQVMLKPLSRNENISTILNILKKTQILNYRIKGRTVTLSAP